MSDKLTQDIRTEVDNIFKQKEEVAMRKQTEEALNRSAEKINELVASLEAKDVEVSELGSKLSELEETVSELSIANKDLKESLEKATSDFEAENEELTKRAETAEKELEDMKKDQLAQARFVELKDKGVSATDEAAIKDQVAKIREMEEEAFEAYMAERVELRNSVIAELEASSSEETTEETTEEESGSEEGSSEEETTAELENAEDEELAAADSESTQEPMKAMAALFNMETSPSADIVNKYRELGKEMAKRYGREQESK